VRNGAYCVDQLTVGSTLHQIRLQGVATTIDVVVGEKIAESITDYARREKADLIAIATHGRGGLARVLRGSVADAVTKCAMSSILVFHPDKALEKSRQQKAKKELETTAFA
jgi:nucleotide-binding universal stress UspA family protein